MTPQCAHTVGEPEDECSLAMASRNSRTVSVVEPERLVEELESTSATNKSNITSSGSWWPAAAIPAPLCSRVGS